MTYDTCDDDDFNLFRETVGEVNRLRHDKVTDDGAKPKPHPHQAWKDEQAVLKDMLSDTYDPTEIQPGDALHYCRPGVKKSTFRKLKSGEYRVCAELDLHGMTVPVARQAVAEFLQEAQRHGDRCLRIVHGKGRRSSNQGPILKSMVNRWLRQRDEVLAFSSARPVDGGTGAVYVLLRRG